MNLCSNGHDEVCFEGKWCPCCAMLNEISKYETKLNNYYEENQELQNQLSQLESKIPVE